MLKCQVSRALHCSAPEPDLSEDKQHHPYGGITLSNAFVIYIKRREAVFLWLGIKTSCTLTHNIHWKIFVPSVPSCSFIQEQSAALYEWIIPTREGTAVIKTSVCLCDNGESVPTGSAALSMSRIVRKAMATQTPLSENARQRWATAWEKLNTWDKYPCEPQRGFSSVIAAN